MKILILCRGHGQQELNVITAGTLLLETLRVKQMQRKAAKGNVKRACFVSHSSLENKGWKEGMLLFLQEGKRNKIRDNTSIKPRTIKLTAIKLRKKMRRFQSPKQ